MDMSLFRFGLAALALWSLCSIKCAAAEGMRNLSTCVHWQYWRDEVFGGQNTCEFPVAVRFVSQFDRNEISKILRQEEFSLSICASNSSNRDGGSRRTARIGGW